MKQGNKNQSKAEKDCDFLFSLFDQKTGAIALVDSLTYDTAKQFIENNNKYLKGENDLLCELYHSISRKLKINEERLRLFYKQAASFRIKLDFHKKELVRLSYDWRSLKILSQALGESAYRDIKDSVIYATDEEIIHALRNELKAPINRRTKKRDPSLSRNLATAIFAEYIFKSVPQKVAQQYFDCDHVDKYFDRISKNIDLFKSTQPSLSIAHFPRSISSSHVYSYIERQYRSLRNHSFLVLIFELSEASPIDPAWGSALDSMLFAEKAFRSGIKNSFFRYKTIQEQASAHIPYRDVDECEFNEAFFGFQYVDCFVVDNRNNPSCPSYLIEIFELNKADETRLRCPTCRSENVEGNSYSKIGVRSWECQNPICADRSRSGRGKRFSIYSAIRQEYLLDESCLIEADLIKQWNRDVVENASLSDAAEMIVKFFSAPGDVVSLYGGPSNLKDYGRLIKQDSEKADLNDQSVGMPDAYIKRFVVDDVRTSEIPKPIKAFEEGGQKLLLGDSTRVLASIAPNSVDAAVTSPPYYNAREYSQWPNIYTYLYDMYQNAKQVHRVLKDGSVYLFNIFDYFDNENDIVFSAMGKKRLILSAQLKSCFESAGFNFLGNITWDKGHIEGKRGFNGGNMGPYYQQPFNCWEHILIFSKGEASESLLRSFPFVLKAHPVIKIVGGQNTYGHTAPFPVDVPDLITGVLPQGATVLDPYAGSCTTAISAIHANVLSICIEQDKSYFELGRQRIQNGLHQPRLRLIGASTST